MKKISKIIVLLLIALFVTETTVLAASINNLTYENGKAICSVGGINEDIEKLSKKVNDNKKEIIKTSKAIDNLKKEISKNEKNIKNNEDIFKSRVRAMYIRGFSSYLEVLLKSDNLDDFVNRVDMVKLVINKDKEVLENFKNNKKNLQKQKDILIQKNNKLIKLKEENEKKLLQIKQNKEKESKSFGVSKNKNSGMKIYSQSNGKCVPSLNNVVNYSYGFLGIPYVWGGTTTSGFDCSGFTQYIFKHFGVRIGRTTYEQIKSGNSIARQQLLPGDLVFFGTYSNPHHVGIYIGNNSYIHASHTGDVVKISNLSDRRDYLIAKRVN